MQQSVIPMKVGDTLSLAGTCKLPTGTWSATGALCDAENEKVADLIVALTALDPPTDTATHNISVLCAAVTMAALDPGRHLIDVKFTDADDVVIHSPSIAIDLAESQTP